MEASNAVLMARLTRCKPGSAAHLLIANWPVPEADQGVLTYLGGFRGFDLYIDLSSRDLTIRYGKLTPDFVRIEVSGFKYDARIASGGPISEALKTAKYRAKLAGVL